MRAWMTIRGQEDCSVQAWNLNKVCFRLWPEITDTLSWWRVWSLIPKDLCKWPTTDHLALEQTPLIPENPAPGTLFPFPPLWLLYVVRSFHPPPALTGFNNHVETCLSCFHSFMSSLLPVFSPRGSFLVSLHLCFLYNKDSRFSPIMQAPF